MLNTSVTQFKLGDDGIIRYQPDASNPLPGEPAAKIVKGAKILEPGIELLEGLVPGGQDGAPIAAFISEWTKNYIRQVLEPLVALEQAEGLAEPVRGIYEKLYGALGIVPREDVERFTAALEPDMRQALRSRHVRLGPVLVFLPALNKPAGVRLRGLLWSLWNDKELPPKLPHDGIVSLKVDDMADQVFYRAIGYPVYGPRAIRIDMLDRVISAVYDSAKDGKFQAQHKMAEWLGCQIDDLYGVLTAMGHRKINDPLENKKAEEVVAPVEEKPAAEAAPEAASQKVPQEKPGLATFALKKGKAFEKKEFKPRAESKSDSAPREKKKDKPKFKKPDRKKENKPERPRMIHASAKKIEDSPFAILEQLKARKDGS